MHIRRRPVLPKPLVAFRPALKPSADGPSLVDLPGRHRPRRRPRAAASLERHYACTPRRILIAFAILAAAFVVVMAWTFMDGSAASTPHVGADRG